MKEEEPIKIEIEEEDVAKAEKETINLSDEFRQFGEKFAETVQSAWNSEQRQKVETEFRDGMKKFADELHKVFDQINETGAAQKVREEAQKLDSSDIANNMKGGLSQGLRWLSTELGKISDMLDTPPAPADAENSPEDDKTTEA